MPAQLTELKIQDVAIKLHRAGSGPKLLFLHGVGGVPQWLPFFDALLWAIERKLAEEDARPIIFYAPTGACWQPYVKGLTIIVASIFNGDRREDLWLGR